MKKLLGASKALSVLFAVIWMVGCASSGPSDEEIAAAEEAERRAAEQAAMEQAAMERAEAERAAAAAQQQLVDAAAAAGNVVYFDFDSSTLTPASLGILDAHIALAHTNDGNFRLEGHADERGTREYNIALGERRAKAVLDYMAANGVAGHRMETVSYGEERPVAYGSGEENWSQNRRVELQ